MKSFRLTDFVVCRIRLSQSQPCILSLDDDSFRNGGLTQVHGVQSPRRSQVHYSAKIQTQPHCEKGTLAV